MRGFLEVERMDAYFKKLGRKVLTGWKRENFSLAAFPDIARKALEERPPSEHVEVSALAKDFLLSDEQPFQTSSGFGQPELVVFDDPRFCIQVLFWLDGTTQIHQHGFSGAFHVLAGSSLHSEFVFENRREITTHFQTGDLRLKGTELLETGRTVPITSGGTCIHSLFHLDTPSITVVVRTHADSGAGPQFTYLPPHVAVDPFFTDALTSRRCQLLDVLAQTEDPAYPDLGREMIADLDFESGFFVLQNCLCDLRRLGEWEETWEVFSEKHGELAVPIAPTLEEIVWRDSLVGLRGTITEPAHRFFLALLLNVPGRARILDLVAQRFSGDPVTTVLRWAKELSETSAAGTWILNATFPEEQEVAPSRQLPLFLALLEMFIRNSKSAKASAPKTPEEDVEAIRGAFLQSSLRALVAEN